MNIYDAEFYKLLVCLIKLKFMSSPELEARFYLINENIFDVLYHKYTEVLSINDILNLFMEDIDNREDLTDEDEDILSDLIYGLKFMYNT